MKRLMRHSLLQYFYIACSIIFLLAALFHLRELWLGPFSARHLLFVFVNIFTAVMCLKRPRILFPLFLIILSMQQIQSHGTDLINTWQHLAKIDWKSFLVLIFLPFLLLITLFSNQTSRKN